MAEAYIYDAVRTPRGRGKKDGALHEVPAVRLAAKTLEAIRDRNGLDTAQVDDIIFGCVDPVGEAGAVIPRSAAFEAGRAGIAIPGPVPGSGRVAIERMSQDTGSAPATLIVRPAASIPSTAPFTRRTPAAAASWPISGSVSSRR